MCVCVLVGIRRKTVVVALDTMLCGMVLASVRHYEVMCTA